MFCDTDTDTSPLRELLRSTYSLIRPPAQAMSLLSLGWCGGGRMDGWMDVDVERSHRLAATLTITCQMIRYEYLHLLL